MDFNLNRANYLAHTLKNVFYSACHIEIRSLGDFFFIFALHILSLEVIHWGKCGTACLFILADIYIFCK